MCARALRAPVFFGSLTRQTGRCAPPPAYCSFAASPKIKINIPGTKCFLFGPNSGRQGRISFHWAKLCTLLSYSGPSWSTLHPPKLRCTLMSYTAPYGATLHPIKLCCILWAKLHPSELSCTLLRYAAPFWATVNPICATLHPSELRCTLLSYLYCYHSCTDPTSDINNAYVEKTPRNITVWQKIWQIIPLLI